MRVTPLGVAGGGVPRAGGAGTGLLVQSSRTNLLVDIGNGVLGNLVRHLDYGDVSALAITHLHFDHTLDLMPFLLARTRFEPVPVHGPPGSERLFSDLIAMFTNSPGLYLDQMELAEYRPGEPFRVGDLTVTPVPVEHAVPANAMRITDGRHTVAYSADSRKCPALVEAARDADLFFCEATFLDLPETASFRGHHMSGREAGEVAAAARVKRLLLTHMVYYIEPALFLGEARESYGGPVEAARENVTYSL